MRNYMEHAARYWTLLLAISLGLTAPTKGAPVQGKQFRIEVIQGLDRKAKVALRTTDRSVDVDIYHIRLAFTTANPKLDGADVVLVHDPEGGAAWWLFSYRRIGEAPRDIVEHIRKNWTFYLRKDGITSFNWSGTTLLVLEHNERQATPQRALDHVLNSLRSKSESLQAGGTLSRHFASHARVEMSDVLGDAFFFKRPTSVPSPAKISQVSMKGGHWRVEVDGGYGDKAVVRMSRDFKVEGAEVNGTPRSAKGTQ